MKTSYTCPGKHWPFVPRTNRSNKCPSCPKADGVVAFQLKYPKLMSLHPWGDAAEVLDVSPAPRPASALSLIYSKRWEGGKSLLCWKEQVFCSPEQKHWQKQGISVLYQSNMGENKQEGRLEKCGCCDGSCRFRGGCCCPPDPCAEPQQEQACDDLCRCFLPIKRQRDCKMCRFYTWKSNVVKGILLLLGI